MAEKIDVGDVIVQRIGEGDMTTFADIFNKKLQDKGIIVTNSEELKAAILEIRVKVNGGKSPRTSLGKQLWPVFKIARKKALEVEEEREFGSGAPAPSNRGGRRKSRKSKSKKRARKTRRNR